MKIHGEFQRNGTGVPQRGSSPAIHREQWDSRDADPKDNSLQRSLSLLSIPRNGSREKLIEEVQYYNARKSAFLNNMPLGRRQSSP